MLAFSNIQNAVRAITGRLIGSFFSKQSAQYLLLPTFLTCTVTNVAAQEAENVIATKIDRAAQAQMLKLYGSPTEIIKHIDLTKPFAAKSRWTLVIGRSLEEPSPTDNIPPPLSLCFVKNEVPDCAEKTALERFKKMGGALLPEERAFYELFNSEIVFLDQDKTHSLLMVKTCSMPGGNGNCGISTSLYDYDKQADAFRIVFYNITGRNNNEATRFVENGPLQSWVIVAYPTSNAPYTYFLEAYKRNGTDAYEQALRYRGKTGYGDGNALSVIDSEMPEILKRLGYWKVGDPIPVPPKMPDRCKQLVLRKGLAWCE